MSTVSVSFVAIAAAIMVALVAALHVYILVLEMFLWRTPRGLRSFGMTQEVADSSAKLAANQGLYNGFLAAGLLWGLFAYGVVNGRPILTFFLLCVIVAGVYGGATVNRRITLIQSAPAAIALILVWLSQRTTTTELPGRPSAAPRSGTCRPTRWPLVAARARRFRKRRCAVASQGRRSGAGCLLPHRPTPSPLQLSPLVPASSLRDSARRGGGAGMT